MSSILWPSLLLAGPGVVIGAFMTGGFLAIFPFGWSFNFRMLMGSILSATDPVAVVALLKDAGASSRLTLLIIAESMLNDGTGIVLYTLFFTILSGASYDFGGIIKFLFKELVASPLIGISYGIIAFYWLKFSKNAVREEDKIIQVLVTFICAYFSFISANACGLSGVLSCFAAGSVLSWGAQQFILSPETMHNAWSVVEWMANTVIFMFAGLLYSHRSLRTANWSDTGFLIALYLAINVIRVVVVFLHYPFLKRFKITELLFTSWAGLRGALGILLGLIVSDSAAALGVPQTDANLFFFLIGGIAALSLLVNATLSPLILKTLKLTEAYDAGSSVAVKSMTKELNRIIVDVVVSS